MGGDLRTRSEIILYRERGEPVPTSVLGDEDVASLLFGEGRPLSAMARRELLPPRFAFFEDDLAVLAWNAALVVEPVPEDRDVEYVLEFANAQLLELRYYDSVLDAEIPRIHGEIAAARRAFHLLGTRSRKGVAPRCWSSRSSSGFSSS